MSRRARDDETRRGLKWLSFSKPKVVLGFEHLSPAYVPAMSGKSRGIAILLDKVTGWSPPAQLLKDIDGGGYDLSVQLSFSFFHLNSKSFFGSTWMGVPIHVGDNKRQLPDTFNFDYSDIIYMISKIIDPACVGVIEIVASKVDSKRNIIVSQFGCGWTMVDLFSESLLYDLSDTGGQATTTVCPFLAGSPRDLLLGGDTKELKNCALHFKLYNHRKLLKMQRLVAENEAIGRHDVIAGLRSKQIVTADDMQAKDIPCIGDEQIVDKIGNVTLHPSTPNIILPWSTKLIDLQVFVPRRAELERRMVESLARDISDSDKMQAQILSRTLKVAVHNGHTVLGGDWQTFKLNEDEEDKDLVFAGQQTIDINGYIPHELMSIVFLIEYEVGVPMSQRTTYNTQAVLNSTLRRGKAVTTVNLGGGIYVPSNGKLVFTRNQSSASADFGIEIPLRYDDLCSVLSFRPNYGSVDKVLAYKKNKILPKGESSNEDKNDSNENENAIVIAFDLKLFNASKVELEHEDDVGRDGGVDEDQEPVGRHDRDISVRQKDDRDKNKNKDEDSDRDRDRDAKKEFAPSKSRDRSISPQAKSVPIPRQKKPQYVSKPLNMTREDDNNSVAESLVGGDSDVSSLRLDPRYYSMKVKNDDVVSAVSSDDGIRIPDNRNSLLAQSMQAKIKGPSRRQQIEEELPYDTRRIADKKSIAVSQNVSHARELSRGVKSKLNRHGFDGVIDQAQAKAVSSDSRVNTTQVGHMVDVSLEANDKLTTNDVTIQFAGYRAALPQNSLQGSVYHPRSVYFSYQFFTCGPTRTETMRLLPAEKGQACVLARDEAYARDEAPLALRYIVDCSTSSPTESYEFAEYLAHSTLFIDVWDAESLLLLGTCSVPLRRIMRQGQVIAKSALECDIVNCDISAQSHGGITSSIVAEGTPVSGVTIGSVHIIVSNFGQPGKADSKQVSSIKPNQMNEVSETDGLNWRATGVDNKNYKSDNSKYRAKNSVRAKPLAESTPELSEALKSFKGSRDGPSVRSLTALRGNETYHTLTYDEVVVLFKRFQGTLKGTVQYTGSLISLLDIPSWSVAVRKVVKFYHLMDDDVKLEKELLRYANAQELIDASNLQECFREYFERLDIACREEELAIIAARFTKGAIGGVKPKDVVGFCKLAYDNAKWTQVNKRLRLCAQNAILAGTDIEQMLAERDESGTGFIDLPLFKQFVTDLAKFGKLSAKDIATAAQHFYSKDKSVSLKEVMAYFGKKYLGNIEARLGQILMRPDNEGITTRTVDELIRIIDSHNSLSDSNDLTYQDMELALGALGVYNHLNRDQVRSILVKADDNKRGVVTAVQLLSYLKLVSNDNMSAQQLLKLLLDRVYKSGVLVEEVFREFDANGDGTISQSELVDGLDRIGCFESIDNWRKEIPEIVRKFDINNDNSVSLKEFLEFIGIKEYVPNIIQRLTKIFALASEKGLSLTDIFNEIDQDKSGEIDSDEMLAGLTTLGTFGEVSAGDVDTIMKQFDKDGNKTVSISEFVHFFECRVKKVKEERRLKNADALAHKFRTVLNGAKSKGLSIEDLFRSFDKNADGNVTVKEFIAGLSRLPYFKNVSDVDIRGMVNVLDCDGNGSVSFKEFKSFMEKGTDNSDVKRQSDTALAQTKLALLQKTFKAAERNGLKISDLFEHIDADKSGHITISELASVIHKMRQFSSITSSDLETAMSCMDTNKDGLITIDEFKHFIDADISADSKRSVRISADAKGGTDKRNSLDRFINEMKRVAISDGGIAGLLAFLDSDEDGLIEVSSLMRLLKKEKVFDIVSEKEIDHILAPLMLKRDLVSVVKLMRVIENSDALTTDVDDDNDDDTSIALVKYDFSHDPETRSLEKKMRGLGRILVKTGVDVEDLFKSYDLRETGMIRRTDFLEVMSKMGLYILEQGKVLDKVKSGDDSDVRRMQSHQINRLKNGNAPGRPYAQTAARKLVMSDGESGDFKEHLESMALINWYRQSQKKMLLQRVLSHSLAVSIRIYPRFGKTLFFEQPVVNPFAHEERFLIDVNDPEIRLVTALDEWLHLRHSCRPCVGVLGPDPVEAEMFDRDNNGNVQVLLLPHETLYLPFTFMTLIPFVPKESSNSRPSYAKSESKSTNRLTSHVAGEAKGSIDQHEHSVLDSEEPRRTVEIRIISGTHGHVVSVIKVNVCPRPFVVNRTLRFFEPENTIMRRRIQLLGNLRTSAYPGEFSLASKYIHCVEGTDVNLDNGVNGQSKVVVEWGPSNSSNGTLDLFIRYKCSAFPSVGSFYIMLYDDPYQSILHEVWQVVVQSRQRVDIHTNVGTAAAVDLVIRGDRYARRARSFASPSPDMVTFSPGAVFQVVPGAYNKVSLGYTPKSFGSSRVQINLVDVDSKELINSWLLMTTSSAPPTVRTYDVEISKGKATHKKIIFKNPWDVPKKYILISSDEAIMKPRTPVLDIAAYGNSYLRLWFSGLVSASRASEVYLFLNDEQGQNEESFLFRIHRVDS